MLVEAGWWVQSKDKVNLSAGLGVALREVQTESGIADYILFVNSKAVGVIEAKAEDLGYKLLQVQEQSARYAKEAIKIGNFYLQGEKPFVYQSTGTITYFTDYRDPKPREREVFSFHKPETMADWVQQGSSLRERLLSMPALDKTGLRQAQIDAVENLEHSLKNNRPKALIQMATGAGKTFAATTFVYRLLKYVDAKRVLFLVDTKNLGEQAEQAFMGFQPNDDNRKFTELYNVQRLSSHYIASDTQVCISTIQRLYSILKGEALEESAELDNPEDSSWLRKQQRKTPAIPVDYTPKVPIEQFDFIVIDECHRSIYNLWKQVLDYFDAFLIGLTATPLKKTLGFFNENLVSEYTYEQSVIDDVNVTHDTYIIETEISQKGETLKAKQFVGKRDKLTRKERWEQLDEDTSYTKNDLDKKVVNPSQIRNIIREFRRALEKEICPNRLDVAGDYEVPKTLVFAKTDSHADDIIRIIREEFDEEDEFCEKITYKIDDDPKSALARFRNERNPRIIVTVDMIATGTDIKPLEVLLFMRDVRSTTYFEQMKGRGSRIIDKNDLLKVSSAAKCKTRFVIVDAVGVTKSQKTDSRSLERKPSVPLKDLLGAVSIGVADEDLFLSLGNRLLRLNKQITEKQKKKLLEFSGGKNLLQIAKELITAYDQDEIDDKAQREIAQIPEQDRTPALIDKAKETAQEELIRQAASTFNGELNHYLDNIRREQEQFMDYGHIDTITKSEWDRTSVDKAKTIVKEFSDYLELHKDEIKALSIFYDQPYHRREITFKMVKEVMDKIRLEKPMLAPDSIWDAYATLGETEGRNKPQNELTTLVSLIRRACGIDKKLKAFDKTIEANFKNWIFKQNAGQHNRFTQQQMDWLRMIKDHVVSNYHIEKEDFDYTPFDQHGGRGKFYQLFKAEYTTILHELNEALAA